MLSHKELNEKGLFSGAQARSLLAESAELTHSNSLETRNTLIEKVQLRSQRYKSKHNPLKKTVSAIDRRSFPLSTTIPTRFFKITNEKENHHGYQYTDGLNILNEPFATEGSCVPGGFYFTDTKNIFRFLNYGCNLRLIDLPVAGINFKMMADPSGGKWRSNKIILKEKYLLSNIETFKFLVSVGARVDVRDSYALRWATLWGYTDIVKYLIKLGADVNCKNYDPVLMASKLGHYDILRCLIENGADPCALDNSPIQFASEKGHFDSVKYLVEKGADITTDDNYPLKVSCQEGNLDIVKYLVEKGADVNAENNFPIKAAVEYGHFEVVKFLIENGANIRIDNGFLLGIMAEGDLDIFKYLVKKGVDLTAEKDFHPTLFAAVVSGDYDIVRFLLECWDCRSAEDNFRKYDDDIFIMAASNGHLKIVKLLVKRGVNIHINNNFAIRRASYRGYIDIVRYLVSIGANYKIKNHYPIRSALENNHGEVVEYLASLYPDGPYALNGLI